MTRGTFLGVPVIRTTVFACLFWGLLTLADHHPRRSATMRARAKHKVPEVYIAAGGLQLAPSGLYHYCGYFWHHYYYYSVYDCDNSITIIPTATVVAIIKL